MLFFNFTFISLRQAPVLNFQDAARVFKFTPLPLYHSFIFSPGTLQIVLITLLFSHYVPCSLANNLDAAELVDTLEALICKLPIFLFEGLTSSLDCRLQTTCA